MRIETPSLLKGKSTLAGVFWLKHLFQIIFYSVASYQPKCSHSLMFSFSLSLSLLSPSLSPFLPFSFFLFSFSLFLCQFWWLHLSQYLFKYGNKWKEIYVFFSSVSNLQSSQVLTSTLLSRTSVPSEYFSSLIL